MAEQKVLEQLTQFLSDKMIADPVINQIQTIVDRMVEQEKLRQELRQWSANYTTFSKRAAQETEQIKSDFDALASRLKEESRHIKEQIKGMVKNSEEVLTQSLKQYRDRNINEFQKFRQDFDSEFAKVEQKLSVKGKQLEQHINTMIGQNQQDFTRELEASKREQANLHGKLVEQINQSKAHIDRTLTQQEDRFGKEVEQFKKNLLDTQNEMKKSLHLMQQQWHTEQTETTTRLQTMKQSVESSIKELKQQITLFEQSKEDFLHRIQLQVKKQQDIFDQVEEKHRELMLQQKGILELKQLEASEEQMILTNTMWLNRCAYVLAFIPTLPRTVSITDLRHIFGGVPLDGLIKTPFSPPSEALIQVKKYQFETYLPPLEQTLIADLCHSIFRQYHVEIAPAMRQFLQKYMTQNNK